MISADNKILIVDDEASICQILRRILESEQYQISEAPSGKEALSLFLKQDFDLVILDLQLLDTTGIDVAREMIAQKPLIPIVLMSAYGTISQAVEATKLGVYDFMEKPLDRDRIIVTVRNALAYGQLHHELELYKHESIKKYKMIGQSPGIQKVFYLIEKIAAANTQVLILGENGVGKELVAHAIYQQSSRSKKPFTIINCAAMPESLLESQLFGHVKGAFTGATAANKGRLKAADGGTLFLDEIGELSPAAQAKLLRFLETGEIQPVGSSESETVDVRLIAASNKNLKQMVEEKMFREDLYYRLDIFTITVPPLRERTADIPLLLDFFMANHAEAGGFMKPIISPAAMKYLKHCPWSGNVRQLNNFVQRLMIMRRGDLIDLDEVIPLLEKDNHSALPSDCDPCSIQEARNAFERQFILKALKENDWIIVKTAKVLKMERSHLYRKMRVLGIHAR